MLYKRPYHTLRLRVSLVETDLVDGEIKEVSRRCQLEHSWLIESFSLQELAEEVPEKAKERARHLMKERGDI